MSFVSRVLPWLSIRSKLIIAFAGLSVIPLLLVGLHGVFSNVTMMERTALENLTHDVLTVRENTANFLNNIEGDLRVLRHSFLLNDLIASLEQRRPDRIESRFQQLRSEILAFAQTKEIYYQIRIVDDGGDELLRIEATLAADTIVSFQSLSENELRHTRESFYFLLVDHLTGDQIAFAPGELVDENDRRIPVISFAMPLIGSKERVGILIANVFAKDLFRVIEAKRHLAVQGKIVLVSSDGHYLYHSEKKKDWNRLLASREEDNLQHDYSASIVKMLLSGEEGIIKEGVDEIISYAPLFPAMDNRYLTPGFASLSFIIETVPKDFIVGPVRSFAWTFASLLGIFLFVAIGLGLLATRQLTKPIAELRHGAEIVAKGNYSHRIRVETHDEIETLGQQFNAMAASLESHESEIKRHRTKLEEMVRSRTHELSEEKTKIQAILDHVPSAIVLVDKDFRIQSASAAFSTITGRCFDEVKGKDCRVVFFKNGFCRECVCRKAKVTNTIESHVDQTYNHTMGERFIEHIAIPMKDNGEVGSLLEIITDVTERKKFEKHLLQTERLATAGEMSAIIAHGFRNSLTSIKMILQLQNESKNLTRPERKSLNVALNSIEQMECIVTELLNFARPKPMEFQLRSLNTVVNDGLLFSQPHIIKHGIVIKKELDAKIRPILLDKAFIKESIVNVVLNAVHAFDSGVQRTRQGEIDILTRQECLQKTLRDFALADISNATGHEIVLRKGTECVLVEIKDNGCGIERTLLRRIFDPFFTTKPNGTGLGLPMVKRTVNAHGGIVTVESKPGKGTTFRMYLPRNHETQT